MAEIDWKEARRYLGLHRPGGEVGPELERLLLDCGRELESVARPRSLWRRFPLVLDNGRVECAGLIVESAHLRRHLEGCVGACLFAATLGGETDRLLRRAAVVDMSRAVTLQACAASLLESYCDECCQQIAAETAGEGLSLRPRFSPGYGDFPITCQRALLDALETTKRIGLAATETMMLTPTKSVTAIVGLSPEGTACHTGGCAACGKADCEFRREPSAEIPLERF